jgi:phage baseplate assembly protein W
MANKELALSLPFSVNPYGRISTTTERSKIWQDRVRSVVGTFLGERVMRPNFGADVVDAVHENSEEATIIVETQVRQAFNTYLPTLTLTDVITNYDENTGIMEVEVIYSLPEATVEDVSSTTIGLVRIAGNLPPLQEKL